MATPVRVGIIICDRYRSCAGGKCFRAVRNREGAFSAYAGQDVEVGVVAGDGVEGRDFLAALGDEEGWHGRGLWGKGGGGGVAGFQGYFLR